MCWNFAYADGEAEKAIQNETGIFPVHCQICGKEMVDGKLLSHWKSGQCKKVAMEKYQQQVDKQIKELLKNIFK